MIWCTSYATMGPVGNESSQRSKSVRACVPTAIVKYTSTKSGQTSLRMSIEYELRGKYDSDVWYVV